MLVPFGCCYRGSLCVGGGGDFSYSGYGPWAGSAELVARGSHDPTVISTTG